MKIVIPGGSGQVGTLLARAFRSDGHEVTILSREHYTADWKVVVWDAMTQGDWVREIDGSDVVINLAGRSVNCRYTPENRRQIIDSRVHSTKAVGEAIAGSDNPPRIWLQSSTATIYAHRFDEPNDDIDGIIGGGEIDAPDTWKFSIDVARAWEESAAQIETPKTRMVLMRSAMTMSPDRNGIFDVMLGLVRKGLGGTAGSGKQYISWIHDADFIRSIYWLIEHENLSGPVNIASPEPMPNAEFMRVFRKAWGTRIGIPAMEWQLSIGAVLMNTETELILKSRRVIPRRLIESGFDFEFTRWEDAANDLCKRWRQINN